MHTPIRSSREEDGITLDGTRPHQDTAQKLGHADAQRRPDYREQAAFDQQLSQQTKRLAPNAKRTAVISRSRLLRFRGRTSSSPSVYGSSRHLTPDKARTLQKRAADLQLFYSAGTLTIGDLLIV